MLLTLNYIVSEQEGTRAVRDRRFKVFTVIASYRGEDGQEYRKRFEAKQYPTVPTSGTHKHLNKLREQF